MHEETKIFILKSKTYVMFLPGYCYNTVFQGHKIGHKFQGTVLQDLEFEFSNLTPLF